MGFFKDVNELNKMGKEMRDQKDVAGTYADAHKKMEASQAMMAEQTKLMNAKANGMPGTITVTGVREAPDDGLGIAKCEVDLTVIPQGLPPYPLTVNAVPAQLKMLFGKPAPTAPAKIDPSDPTAVAIDYSGMGYF